MTLLALAALHLFATQTALAQTLSQRGFVDAALTSFPQDAPNDTVNNIGDLLVREELFVKFSTWLQFAAGVDVRANTHSQVDARWQVDAGDRNEKRPALSVRRLSATLSRGPFTLDLGKQFIRWGKTDIVTPTDRFAPRDFLNVIDTEFLPVTGVRAGVRAGDENIDVVWVPVFTPSRIPLLDQRWTVAPPGAPASIVAVAPDLPSGPQTGVRWSHVGSRLEYSLAVFDGFNHLPDIELLPLARPDQLSVRSRYPSLRSYGGDAALPTRWFTLKAEAAYFTSSTPLTDEYVLYVVQIERQSGEWSFVGGYAGDHVTNQRAVLPFAPDRGLTRALVGRASYTIDVNRSVAFETAVRQSGAGGYAKAEYSQAHARHWRTTVSGSLLRGEPGDFIGQYRLNSHLTLALRYSF
jgi:hypothetical protein